MPRLISPGVSVDVEDRSLFTSGRAGTVPLIIIATADEKTQPDGLTPAIGTYEHGVLRTVTSARQALELYGIPSYLYSADGRPHHGDVRNEYGLDALFKYLEVGNRAYVIRANVNLNDDPNFIRDLWERKIQESSETLETLFSEWLQVQNQEAGFVPGDVEFITEVPNDVAEILIRQSLSSTFDSYNFRKDSFESAFLDDTTGGRPGYQDIFFDATNGFLTENSVTGLVPGRVYTATFRIVFNDGVNAGTQDVVVTVDGADAATYGALADQIADQIAGFGVVDLFLSRIRVSSNFADVTSSVRLIADGGGTTAELPLFASTNLFLRVGQPISGRGTGGFALYNEDFSAVDPIAGAYFGLLSALTAPNYTAAQAIAILVSSALQFTQTKEFLNITALGVNDAARRNEVVTTLQAVVNDPRTEIRTDGIDYDLVACPGFPELVDEMQRLSDTLLNEVFVIGETPFTLPPVGPNSIASWARTPAKVASRDVGYWYGHGLSSNIDGREILTTASTAALRVIAFSDRETDVFYAPAGVVRGRCQFLTDVGYVSGTLGGPTTFVRNLLDRGTRDALYEFPVDVNPITFEVGVGIIAYGQKTTQGFESALDRINVSRLVKRIKRVLRRSLRPFVFEPNDQITRDLVAASVNGYLSTLLGRRALQDYAVQCDARNNPPDRVGANELYVDIAIKPTTSAEFIYARLIVVRQDADLTNLGEIL